MRQAFVPTSAHVPGALIEALRQRIRDLPTEEGEALVAAARQARIGKREYFDWTSPEGEDMCFDITGLNAYLDANAGGWRPITFDLNYDVEVIALANRGPELGNLLSLAQEPDHVQVRRPATLIDHGGHPVFVDGTHRVSLWLLNGWKIGNGRLAEEGLWRQFLVPAHLRQRAQ